LRHNQPRLGQFCGYGQRRHRGDGLQASNGLGAEKTVPRTGHQQQPALLFACLQRDKQQPAKEVTPVRGSAFGGLQWHIEAAGAEVGGRNRRRRRGSAEQRHAGTLEFLQQEAVRPVLTWQLRQPIVDTEEALVQRGEMEGRGSTDRGASRQAYDLGKALVQSTRLGENERCGVDQLFALPSWLLAFLTQAGHTIPQIQYCCGGGCEHAAATMAFGIMRMPAGPIVAENGSNVKVGLLRRRRREPGVAVRIRSANTRANAMLADRGNECGWPRVGVEGIPHTTGVDEYTHENAAMADADGPSTAAASSQTDGNGVIGQ
jgi:hypothetical protein